MCRVFLLLLIENEKFIRILESSEIGSHQELRPYMKIDEPAEWTTRVLRQKHTAGPVAMEKVVPVHYTEI